MLFGDVSNALGSSSSRRLVRRGGRDCYLGFTSFAVCGNLDEHGEQLALLLSQCGSGKSLHDGRLLHSLLSQTSLECYPLYNNRLLRMYAKCGALHDAISIFDRTDQRDPHTWRFMMNTFSVCGDFEASLQIFNQMMMEDVLPTKGTAIAILSSCAGTIGLVEGTRIHASIIGSDLELDVDVVNTVINMYKKYQDLSFAIDFFYDMHWHNVISFNTLMSGFAEHEKGHDAIDLFFQMESEAILPTSVTFVSVVSACGAIMSSMDGRKMHVRVLHSDYASDIVLGNAFLNMYGKCESLEDAERLFWDMPTQDIATCNCMITLLIQHKRDEEALQLFKNMQVMGLWPNNVTFANILSAYVCEQALDEARRLHLGVLVAKCELDVVLGTALVNMYSRCGGLEDASKVFANMSNWDVVLCNTTIELYMKCGKTREAVELFEEMQLKGLPPTKVTFINLLPAFDTLEEGKQIHAIVFRHGFEADMVVGTGLMNMYTKCGSLHDVSMVFDKMPEHDLVSWNAFLGANGRHGRGKEVLQHFQMMFLEGFIPDKVSFISLCEAIDGYVAPKEVSRIHALILASKVEMDVHIINGVLRMLNKCGMVESMHTFFGEANGCDESTWNAMIAVHTQVGTSIEALAVYRQMQVEGFLPNRFTIVNLLLGFADGKDLDNAKHMHASVSGGDFEADATVANALMNMYGKLGKLEDARILFDTCVTHDVVSWNGLLSVYAQFAEGEETVSLFQRMLLECLLPDRVTLINVVSACASKASLADGKHMHVRILTSDLWWDINLSNGLINMYGKGGSVKEASRIFQSMQKCDIVSWNAILTAHAFHGHGKEALHLYYQMQEEEVVPNGVTYIIILSACSHSGLLKEGLDCFIAMIRDYGIRPREEHVNLIVDLLGRAGLLDEGEGLIYALDSLPNSLSWMNLLGFCKIHNDANRGERVATRALHYDAENTALYVLLSNIYASTDLQTLKG